MASPATVASRQNRLLKWRAALGAFRQNATPRPRILCIGDSKMMGGGAGSAPNTYTTGAYSKRRTAMLAGLLSDAGFRALDQAFVGNNAAPDHAAYDGRVSLGSGWAWSTGTVGNHFGNASAQNTTTTGNMAFSPIGTFDTIDVIYAQGPTAGVFTVSDGASLQDTVTATNATAKPVRRTISLASRGSGKTINIARSSGFVGIFAVIAYDSTQPSIELLNGGIFGSRTADWMNSGSFGPANATGWEAYAPHLTFIALGANDKNNSIAVATFSANIQTLITRAQVSGDVVLVNESYGSGGYATLQDEYRQGMIDLATANGCLFHDEAARVNITSNPTWFADNIHEKDFAHADEARDYLPYVLPHLLAA